jgi:hypothetical protein
MEPTNQQDPLAQFSNAPQPTTEFEFAGTKWPSREAAEAAWNQHVGRLATEKEALEKSAQAFAAQQQQAKPQQFATGAEPEGYNHQKYLSYLGENADEANFYLLEQSINNPKSKYGTFMRNLIQTTMATQSELNRIKLQQAHPEINWNDPKTVEMIESERRTRGFNYDVNGSEATIAMLQRDRKLPTPEEFQQRMWAAQQQQQQAPPPPPQAPGFYPNVYEMPQQAPPVNSAPPVFGKGYSTQTFDVNAALAKMQDPRTSVEESRAIRDALIAQANNPTSAVG